MTLSNDYAASRACERRFLRSSSNKFVSFGKAIFKQPHKARISDVVKSIAEISVKMKVQCFEHGKEPNKRIAILHWVSILYTPVLQPGIVSSYRSISALVCLSTSPIIGLDKRQWGDDSLSFLIPNFNLDFCALLVRSGLDVSHGDVLVQRGGWYTRSDDAKFLTGGSEDFGAL